MTTDRLTDTELDAIRERSASRVPRYNDEGGFEGHSAATTARHRTVGSHRAWCDCGEWCYPSTPCSCCETRDPDDVDVLLAEVERLRAELAGMTARYAPAYRSPITGVVCPLGAETVVRGDADTEAGALRAESGDEHDVFVARRLMTPWVPVKDGDQP